MEKITKNNYSEQFRLFNLRRVESEATIEHYRVYMDLFFRYTGADFEDFGNQKHFAKCFEKLFKIESIKNETRKKFLKISRLFGDFLVENEIIEYNAPRAIKPPKTTTPLPLPIEENILYKIKEIIQNSYSGYLQERNLMIFETLLHTGARKMELLNIEQKYIFQEKIFIKSGKGNKDRYIYLDTEFSQKLQKFVKKYPGKYLFSNIRKEKLGESGLKNLFLKIKSHIQEPMYAHRLRHTYATILMEKGVDIGIIKEQLGHSDISTTNKYIRISNEHRRKILENIHFS
ncbi:MAG: tyrosine-type recombinase/integrase [Candidatus Gracilibacteria bacterium]|nr:tyrosine-type recombinase/integrase [Candidatus Gracilibacteria bacterium]